MSVWHSQHMSASGYCQDSRCLKLVVCDVIVVVEDGAFRRRGALMSCFSSRVSDVPLHQGECCSLAC